MVRASLEDGEALPPARLGSDDADEVDAAGPHEPPARLDYDLPRKPGIGFDEGGQSRSEGGRVEPGLAFGIGYAQASAQVDAIQGPAGFSLQTLADGEGGAMVLEEAPGFPLSLLAAKSWQPGDPDAREAQTSSRKAPSSSSSTPKAEGPEPPMILDSSAIAAKGVHSEVDGEGRRGRASRLAFGGEDGVEPFDVLDPVRLDPGPHRERRPKLLAGLAQAGEEDPRAGRRGAADELELADRGAVEGRPFPAKAAMSRAAGLALTA